MRWEELTKCQLEAASSTVDWINLIGPTAAQRGGEQGIENAIGLSFFSSSFFFVFRLIPLAVDSTANQRRKVESTTCLPATIAGWR